MSIGANVDRGALPAPFPLAQPQNQRNTPSSSNMITPAQGFLLSTAGNAAMCVGLPRKQVTDIYLNGTQIQDNSEADAGWRFFGLAGGAACAAVYLADKTVTNADDRKILNGAIAANAIGNAALFVQHKVRFSTSFASFNLCSGVFVLFPSSWRITSSPSFAGSTSACRRALLASPSRPSSTRSNFTTHAIYDDPAGRRKSRDTPPDTAGGRRCYTQSDTIQETGPRDEIKREFLMQKSQKLFLLGQANPRINKSRHKASHRSRLGFRANQMHQTERSRITTLVATATFPRQLSTVFFILSPAGGAEDLARDACANLGTSWFARHLTAPQSLASVSRVGTLPAAKLPRYRRQRLPKPTRRQQAIGGLRAPEAPNPPRDRSRPRPRLVDARDTRDGYHRTL